MNDFSVITHYKTDNPQKLDDVRLMSILLMV